MTPIPTTKNPILSGAERTSAISERWPPLPCENVLPVIATSKNAIVITKQIMTSQIGILIEKVFSARSYGSGFLSSARYPIVSHLPV